MTVEELIKVLEKMDKNKKVDIYDTKIGRWREFNEDDVEENRIDVAIIT